MDPGDSMPQSTRALQSTELFVLISISLRSIQILSSHLRLSLPKVLLPTGVPVKILKAVLPSSILATWPAHLLFYLFFTVVLSNSCVFLSCRHFVVNTMFSRGLVGVEVSSVSSLGARSCWSCLTSFYAIHLFLRSPLFLLPSAFHSSEFCHFSSFCKCPNHLPCGPWSHRLQPNKLLVSVAVPPAPVPVPSPECRVSHVGR